MKKLLCLFFTFYLFSACLFGCDIINKNKPNDTVSTFVKAGWVATVWGIDYPSNYTKNSDTLKRELDTIVNNAKEVGLNTLFFQVRPASDAFYKSDIFPWSRYLTGIQGTAPNNNFDPLNYLIEICHDAGLELHAWVNPFRITAAASDMLVAGHPAVMYPELTITVDGKCYFNPGNPQARQLIIDGIYEIALNYNVDGIHFDDYFYPQNITAEHDINEYNLYGSGFNNIGDFRRACVNTLIKDVRDAIYEIDENLAFGISPSGIWANSWHNSLGSNTNGFESYYEIFADSYTWVKEGIIDYIAPQLYWYTGQNGSDFLTLIKWWKDICEDTGVKLIIGLAGYKMEDPNYINNWSAEEFKNQIEYCKTYADGFSIFSYSDTQKANVSEVLNEK